jgi:hypothetical protein
MAYELWQQVAETTRNHYLKDMAEQELGNIRQAMALGRPELVVHHQPTPRVVLR